MKVEINGADVHVGTGGREHVAGRPAIVFLHGAGNCNLTWVSQGRALAYDGYNIIAPDMPGHNLSGGEPLEGVAAQADWYLALMDALNVEKAVLVGHSQGGLIGLDFAAKAPDRVAGIGFIATANAIPVNDALIGMAETKQDKAIAAMTAWGPGPQAHMHDNTWPGASNITYGLEVMELNAETALAIDLKSCAGYADGLEKAKGLTCPTLCIFAGKDKMTPVKFGKALASVLPDNELHILPEAGHMLPVEQPREVNALLRGFLARLQMAAAA